MLHMAQPVNYHARSLHKQAFSQPTDQLQSTTCEQINKSSGQVGGRPASLQATNQLARHQNLQA